MPIKPRSPNAEIHRPGTIKTSQGEIPIQAAFLLVGLDRTGSIGAQPSNPTADLEAFLEGRLPVLVPTILFRSEIVSNNVEQTVNFASSISVTIWNAPASLAGTSYPVYATFEKTEGGDVGPILIHAFGSEKVSLTGGFIGVRLLSDASGSRTLIEAIGS